ncbi:hypothetical protein HJG39_18210 [Alteromonas sp. a30]|nr:hypothetical protein [Alteromonas sp. a30]
MTYLRYKNDLGTIEPELENNLLFGKLVFIREAVIAADGQSLNAFVCDAIREKIARMLSAEKSM